MERINNIQSVQSGYGYQQQNDKEDKKEQATTKDRVTLGANSQTETYDRTGKVNGSEKPKSLVTLQQIEIEVAKQAYMLLEEAASTAGGSDQLKDFLSSISGLTGEKEDPLGLGAHFAANPGDLRQVQAGIVPDHFNVENTGQRILDIWKQSLNEETDVNTWVANTKEMISLAYSEVGGMIGSLPQLVLDTRDYIMQELDNMKVENTEQTPVETLM